MEPPSTDLRYRRHWGISSRTRNRLGQCGALVSAIRQTPVRPEDHRRLLDTALARGAMATTAIEGGPLDEHEIGRLMAGRRLPVSREYHETEVMNVVRAARTLLGELEAGTPPPVDANLLLRVHRMIGEDLGERLDAEPGRFRSEGQAAPYTVPRADDVPGLVEGVLDWLSREFPRSGPGGDFGQAIVRALVTHVYMLWIRPFGDGNGRTARLLEAYVLAAAGNPAIAAHLLADHYNETRREYFRQLEGATRDRSLTSFISYAVEGLRDGLRDLHVAVATSNFRVAWRDFVAARLAGSGLRKRSVLERRSELVLAMPLEGAFDIEEVALLDAEVAHTYGGLSRRTLRRDLLFLVETGLLASANDRFSANTALLRPG
ncbi:MAG: Fic family protein [Gemmatimonadota bacterium]|nr:Fic family protein [Gemmatimonadota bacterium]MDE2870806.1 Fic family protein [Gemmatimonadota bacterium]